jgi:hypothetical protein
MFSVVIVKTFKRRSSVGQGSLRQLFLGRSEEAEEDIEWPKTRLADIPQIRTGLWQLKISSIHIELRGGIDAFFKISTPFVQSDQLTTTHETIRSPMVLSVLHITGITNEKFSWTNQEDVFYSITDVSDHLEFFIDNMDLKGPTANQFRNIYIKVLYRRHNGNVRC